MSTIRNIGIAAHIDAGKTTLSERLLYYAGRIHRMGEVRGEGATMDHHPIEKERGITIQSAATWLSWEGHTLHLIDTPGHLDFTFEVERALRVLDGAVLVLCAVAGVQPQTRTVDRQMRRHRLPRLVFINKMDRAGADPARCVAGLRQQLGLPSALLQLPLEEDGALVGLIDLVEEQELRFVGALGQQVERRPLAPERRAAVRAAREELIAQVAEQDEELEQLYLSGEPIPAAQLWAALRRTTLARTFTPALLGAAARNLGVQPLLDAITRLLPSPEERLPEGLCTDPLAPAVGLCFKVDETRYGALSWTRLYQGRLQRGQELENRRSGERHRVGRILRMHAGSTEEIAMATAGDIVALIGLEARSGDTLAAPGLEVQLEGLSAPSPVLAQAVTLEPGVDARQFQRAVLRYTREDPSFRLSVHPETGQRLFEGVGELQLEIYAERLRREHGLALRLGPPEVAWRERFARPMTYDLTLRRQSGGPGQYARVQGELRPGEAGLRFVDESRGGAVPAPYARAFAQGFEEAMARGPLRGAPVVGAELILRDGAIHLVDSSERSFHAAGAALFREACQRAQPELLEPWVRVELSLPAPCLGEGLALLSRRRAQVSQSQVCAEQATISAEAPLAGLFGALTELRSRTSGEGALAIEPLEHRPAA